MEEKEFVQKLLEGRYEVISKKVGPQKFSGVIYVPKEFINKEAVIILSKQDETVLKNENKGTDTEG